ncbi:MAG: DUF1684 domain-containing protein [Wenzhouxiangellaceae bacterium]|nr:DUF1684 domain-containing protein [Wenzhouxiangellaceae bacterium]
MAAYSRLQILLPVLAAAAAIFIAACAEDNGAPGPAGEVSAERFEQINLEWRRRRAARLTEPYGWLSLVELAVLEPGSAVTIGSAPGNNVVVDRGPPRWGTLHVEHGGDHVDFENAAGDAVVFDGRKAASGRMTAGDAEAPTRIESEGIRMHLVDPGGRLALRVRDPQAPTRSGFVGLDYYDLKPQWRIEAEYIEHPQGRTLQVANVMGQLIEEPNPGRARFTHDGKSIELEAVQEDDRLFFIFADRTSGRETYGLGRFLYADLPDDGRVTLDFNQAYNPPCAFNAYTTCPLPPQANRIDAWIRAGERKYAGQPGIESPRTPPRP